MMGGGNFRERSAGGAGGVLSVWVRACVAVLCGIWVVSAVVIQVHSTFCVQLKGKGGLRRRGIAHSATADHTADHSGLQRLQNDAAVRVTQQSRPRTASAEKRKREAAPAEYSSTV